ncbi:hypothetical protein CN357_04970 [Bacillus cereus]|uniref:Uncharacterized protein n=2 Tax=Bacillus cereus group TaxID=86661 RepID=A0A9X6W235_BACCE|nr:hypothetical protein bthur0002_61360 [Bacillus thuringiensis Bt407]PES55551.1 hypothetical protein CN515_05770 [Bacillus cereus]PFA29354.1 hypothetical protein CN384_06335 [Bacillus thuringiensis]PGB15672.1 hypothetical protein COM09_08815 [Bacillus toyonensis]PQZ78314.1 hypothetical protein CQ064_10135 [Bacillus sp. MYb78]
MNHIMTEKERLLAKSDGVKDCVKHLKKKIKAEQRLLKQEEEKDFFANEFQIARHRETIRVLTEEKISLEKYAKKLKHLANEC